MLFYTEHNHSEMITHFTTKTNLITPKINVKGSEQTVLNYEVRYICSVESEFVNIFSLVIVKLQAYFFSCNGKHSCKQFKDNFFIIKVNLVALTLIGPQV